MPGSTVKDKLTEGGTTYEYCETKTSNAGGGPRGIDIWVEGTKGKAKYNIDPNPHTNTKYNKNAAPLYAACALSLAKKHQQAGSFPAPRYTAKWDNETWSLIKI
jgi:hypothetical protein